MVFFDKVTGRNTKLIKGDLIEVRGYGHATILNTNAKKVKILGGDAVVSYEGGQYGTIKQNDVQSVVHLAFSIKRFFKNFFENLFMYERQDNRIYRKR